MPEETQARGADDVDKAVTSPRRRPPVRRSMVLLAIATIALVVFILILGDARRKRTALSRAAWYADTLSMQLGEGGTLPLNLELDVPPEQRPELLRFQWLTREEVRRFRTSDKRVIVAHTRPIRQTLAPRGRAVVFFQAGTVDSGWLTLSEFDGLYTAQKAEHRRGPSGPTRDRSEGP
jgi:hypothetical protein